MNKSQRAEDRSTRSFTASQHAALHQGRKQASFAAPAKKQSREAVGRYKGDPFKGLKSR
jgi:hypothetical protein